MTSPQRMTLTIVKGEDEGRKIVVERGSCKVMGRALNQEQTVLTQQDKIVLQQDDIKRIMKFLGLSQSKRVTPTEPFGGYVRTADAILHDSAISRVHAMTFLGEEGPGILDVGSTNGTFVNNERIDVKELKGGDEIRMGNVRLRVSLE